MLEQIKIMTLLHSFKEIISWLPPFPDDSLRLPGVWFIFRQKEINESKLIVATSKEDEQVGSN